MDLSPTSTRSLSALARCHTGESLLSLSRQKPQLVVCLRHLGCTFCRESLADLARLRPEIEGSGTGIILVHPGDDERAAELFHRYGLGDLPRLADPERLLYRALGLGAGSLAQLLGPRILWRAGAAALRGHRPGRIDGDPRQMPGIFLIADGQIAEAYRHRDVADKPDYRSIASRLGRSRAAGVEVAPGETP